MNKVCVDASLVMKWLVPEEGSQEAFRALKALRDNNTILTAPSILDYEIGSVLRKKLLTGALTAESIYPTVEFYTRLNILLFHITNLVQQALSLAQILDQPTIYDAAYLLIAKQQEVNFITADKKFFNACRPIFPFVKYYQDTV